MADKLHEAVKPFDHKPEKRGPDGKIISAEYYGTHIVNGHYFHYYYKKPNEFYHTTGEPIALSEVPEVCKIQLGKALPVPKPDPNSIIKSTKKPDESNKVGSLV